MTVKILKPFPVQTSVSFSDKVDDSGNPLYELVVPPFAYEQEYDVKWIGDEVIVTLKK